MLLFQVTNTPVPKDIPLPLPLPEWLLVILLVFSFLVHIIFIHLMVGGSMLTLWAQIKGQKNKDYEILAHELAGTITVNKSMAVVMGVAPLLSINALYTIYFYSANALTGGVWIMIIPLVTLAFLLTYLHKYSWNVMASNRNIHIGIIGLAVCIFLFIPLIFLTNVNLMMFPEKWSSIKGFISALLLPNVLPRYAEFLGGCLSLTGIFMVWYNKRTAYPFEEIYSTFTRNDVKKIGYNISGIGLSIQIIAGLIVMATLPSKGIGFDVLGLAGISGIMLATALWLNWKTVSSTAGIAIENNRYLKPISISLLLFLVFYGGSRQMYRSNALKEHRQLMAAYTTAFQELSKTARENPAATAETYELNAAYGAVAKGQAIFATYCAGCHKEKEKLVGPPVSEMSQIYAGNDSGLKNWIKAPGKKRPDAPQMPAFAQLPSEELDELSKYILSIQ